ncbi:unnamed protein product [Rotaria sordida]|uniref:Uncharacterized protein n=1 Tax=Rotaria sordida TaxID=392033 RepID=A0A819Y4S5_9BILA|nr:unnamed protein product [Rotaria sordida]CAF4152742.1 unnamed protein product [Rotaria sordida]
MTSEDVEEDDHLNTEEEIRFAAIKEQAILLSGEISDHCRLFRDRLRSRQILGYTDSVAKLYYDIAYANYKYYHQRLVNDNLLSVKKCLEKSIEQFTSEQQLADKINIVKEAKYFLDSVCDLYFFQSDIQQNSLPEIPGNAVVLVATKKPNEYLSYFVENGVWVKDGSHLKFIQLCNRSREKIKFNDKSRYVKKTERNVKQIENITKAAQLQRGRASVNIKYYALKRKRKKLEQELEKIISCACNIEDEEENSSHSQNFFHRGFHRFMGVLRSIFEQSGSEAIAINNLSSVVFDLLCKIIECNLEIGHTDQVEYYIDILKNLPQRNLQDKLNEYNLRKELIVRVREIIDCETALLTAPEDDVQYLIVKKPENISEYNKETEKWKRNSGLVENNSILFLYNPTEKENHWESWFWIPKKRQKSIQLNILENSILSVFLKHIYLNKTANLFSTELLDMLTDENIPSLHNQLDLKSKRRKIIDFCNLLSSAYEFIGHDPLQERYRQVVDYFLREKNQFLERFSTSVRIESHGEKSFPLSLFPISSNSSTKKLNDRITENEFFNDILPYINQINDLKRSFNFIHSIDWRLCHNRENFLQNWLNENEQFKKDHPYERKYLFLLSEYDFYLILDFHEEKLPQISGNGIILTKIPQNNNDYKAYFVKDGCWLKDIRTGDLMSVIVKNINLENIQRDERTGSIDKENFPDRNRIEKLVNRWYFYGEVAYGRVSEGFIDQKQELKSLEIYLKDITPDDVKNKNFLDKEFQILNYLSEIYKDNRFSSSQDYFLKALSKIDYDRQISLNQGIRIYDLRKTDHGKDLRKQIQSDRNRNLSCIIKLSNKHYMALLIEHEKPYHKNYSLRYIYVLNSTTEKCFLKKLKWFTGVIDQCVYKLQFIQCPKQKLMSEDSFLHAYFNARACQWACENKKHWEFLKKFSHQQDFSTKENIEKIRQWFVENTENISISNRIDEGIPQEEKFKSIQRFKTLFSAIVSSYFNSIETTDMDTHIEKLTKTFITIKTFEDISECLCNINGTENSDEITECMNAIKETNDIDSIIDIMFVTLKEYSLNLLFV